MKRTTILCLALLCLFAGLSATRTQANASDDSARCSLAPDPGPCKGLFEIYYYDAQSRSCRPSFYGGCQGVVPFETLEQCQAACENPAELRILHNRGLSASPYAVFDVEYPKDMPDVQFSVQVNGAPAEFRWLGGGSDTEKQSATLQIPLGPAGKKDIAVTAAHGGKSLDAQTSLYWQAEPVVALLDHFGENEALLQAAPLKLFLFEAGEPEALLNGKEIPATVETGASAHGTVLSLSPDWAPGANTLIVRAVDKSGRQIPMEFTFVNLEHGAMSQGASAELVYGYPGSRSGPFFYVSCDSPAIVLANDREVRVDTLDAKGWFGTDHKLVISMQAAQPGSAVIRIDKKMHFTQGVEPDREIRVTVAPGK